MRPAIPDDVPAILPGDASMRRQFSFPILVLLFAAAPWQAAAAAHEEVLPRPTPEQAAWQDREMGLFYHFDISVFTDGGEGDWKRQGHLDPNLYRPAKLNTDQWLEAAKAMGAGYTVFVAKHCTGFISWQSDAYPYGVRQSKWRDGHGDVVADYVASCRKYGIRPGIYCSMPANAYCDVFDNCTVKGANGPHDPRQIEYRRRAERLVTELWGNYGPLDYIWFDGGTLPPDKGGPDLVPILKRRTIPGWAIPRARSGSRVSVTPPCATMPGSGTAPRKTRSAASRNCWKCTMARWAGAAT
jgi:hypothetical protein